ncbi:MAG: 4-alpha-glucanotransferase [Deltaproteobacteria bacterium]|nr:4-alpha-glucanotransferase [Deltaproteobacteria bacterium]
MDNELHQNLRNLARLYGIFPEYEDGFGQLREVSSETLFSVLRSLGLPLTRFEEAERLIFEAPFQYWNQFSEPVILVETQCPLSCVLRISKEEVPSCLQVYLSLETGETRSWSFRFEDLPTLEQGSLAGKVYFSKQLKIFTHLSWGYHRVVFETLLRRHEVLLISAPPRAYIPQKNLEQKTWGVFAPLYALHSKEGSGAGTFSDFEKLLHWVQTLGGSYAATLPLFASFFDHALSVSPYSPVSRLFWNEFYLDLEKIPEIKRCASAKAILNSAEFQTQLQVFRNSPRVDYVTQMSLKQKVLAELARYFFKETSARQNQFQEYLKLHPRLKDYAQFRALHEKLKSSWTEWPIQLREGRVQQGDYPEEIEQYHLYVQWLAQEQVQALAQNARQKGLDLFLDFPLGVHPQGYDAWREEESFVRGVSVGAPPDAFFSQGQNWSFSPLHPQKIREQGYRYFIESLRQVMQVAGLLRIDHVMGLHRLYYIPHGFPATEGCYVSYPTEELYAILCLESHRTQTLLVGEDLGTVPAELRPMMKQRGIFRSYVLQGEFQEKDEPAAVPSDSVASLNTYDMRPFALFWKDRGNAQEALLKYLSYLSESSAAMLLINLEDLWLEQEAQNSPGTRDARNWSRKMRYSMEEFFQLPELLALLWEVNGLRNHLELVYE